MSKQPDPFNWDDAFEETAKANRDAFDKLDTPEARAAREAKKLAEFERGVRNGWWDKDGNPLVAEGDNEEAEEDEEGEDT